MRVLIGNARRYVVRPAALFAATYLTIRTMEMLGFDTYVGWFIASGVWFAGGMVLYYVLVAVKHRSVDFALRWTVRTMVLFAIVGWSWHYGAAPRERQINALKASVIFESGARAEAEAKVQKLEAELAALKNSPPAGPLVVEPPKEKAAVKRKVKPKPASWSLF